MTAYKLVVDIPDFDPEVDDPLVDIPLWDNANLEGMTGSFHEWMGYHLTHDQRLRVRFWLTKLESGDGNPDPNG